MYEQQLAKNRIAWKRGAKKSAFTKLESQLQIAVVAWFGYQYSEYQKSLVKIPNEGKRSWAKGKQMKNEGLRKGFPDMFLFVPRGGYHGMAIEFKAPGRRPEKEQREYLNYLASLKYFSRYFDNIDEAMEIIKAYMEGTING